MKIKLFAGLFLIVLLLWRCNDLKEELYERPDWLEKPIYQTLEKEGRFTKFVKCIEKSSLYGSLSSSGLYTVFAPNDEAFTAFMLERNYESVDDIPKDVINQIVSYAVVYNYFDSAHFGSVLSDRTWTEGVGYKYQTTYYEFLNKEEVSGNQEWVLSLWGYSLQDDYTYFSYKYLPFFTSGYFNRLALTSNDYTQFFPNTTFTGRNVMGGNILNFDILANNGVIHEVSQVTLPPQNFEKKIQYDPAYSKFKDFINFKDLAGQYYYKRFVEVERLTQKFSKLFPDSNINRSFVKLYNTLIPFSLLSEEYNLTQNANLSLIETQKSGFTIFAPTNNALDAFVSKKLLKYYTSIYDVPQEAITAFINAHICEDLVWPTSYKLTKNAQDEFVNGKGSSGVDFYDLSTKVVESKMLSNGIFYGIDRVIKNKLFETVYSEIFLNPDHYMLNRAYVKFYNTSIREELMRSELSGYSSERFTLFLPSDNLLGVNGDGFTYNIAANTFNNERYTGNDEDRLKRLMRQLILRGYKNDQLDVQFTDFTGNKVAPILYGGWKYIVNDNGELIRYKDNQLQAIGNVEDNTVANVSVIDTLNNGVAFSIDRLLQYSPRETQGANAEGWDDKSLWYYLKKARTENPNNAKYFVDFVDSCLRSKDPATPNLLAGINPTVFYTILIPNNSQMNAARTALGLGGTPTNPSADLTADKPDILAKATRFIYSHFLTDRVIADDALPVMYPVNTASPYEIIVPTALKITNLNLDLNNAKTFVRVTKDASNRLVFMPQNILKGDGTVLVVGEKMGGTVGVTRGVLAGAIPNNHRSNRMACKAVIHEINWYIKFTEQ